MKQDEEKKKIGLIDLDAHNFPNLCLMKISSFYKAQGQKVEWYEPFSGYIKEYDKVYCSKVFSFSPDYEHPIYAKEVIRGGSGYAIRLEDGVEVYDREKDKPLPPEIEHSFPDYSLYPELTKNKAFGFLTRGRPLGNKHKYCHVGKKEGLCSVKVADLKEFWNGQKEIVLCDPNILACKDHMDLLRQIAESGAKVDFNQGLDIRLINEENLKLIRQIKLKSVHLAFDDWEEREIIKPKLKEFREATGYGRDKVTVYVLTNFEAREKGIKTDVEHTLERMQFLKEMNFQPYVMPYDKEHCHHIFKKLQRYSKPVFFWKYDTFEEYLENEYKNKIEIP